MRVGLCVRLAVAWLGWMVLVGAARGQMPPMPGMDDSAATAKRGSGNDGDGMMRLMRQMHPRSFVEEVLHHAAAGTSAEPASTPSPMRMSMRGPWMSMLHGSAFVLDEQQSGPRGRDKFFSTNWAMPMAERALGPGQLTLRAMFSLEPATVTGREYPLLFQQGETAFGKAIVDGQHPHNFVMELAAMYDWRLGEKTLVSVYAAPVGDPAIGPTAYAHRASAAEDPVAALGHHQEDSTHISDDVVTVGVTHGWARVEASGFHGREPDESRWTVGQGAMDSWSTRLTVAPGKDWSGQFSYGHLHSLEALYPSENQVRMTASAMYNKPLGGGDWGNWASTAVWGRTRDAGAGVGITAPTGSSEGSSVENSYLLESTLQFARKNAVWTRMENAGRSNELLQREEVLPAGFVETPLTHVQAYTFGYDRDVSTAGRVAAALGAQVTVYGVGAPLQADYGTRPVGVSLFLRLRPF